jgi:uncharacterized protein (DUF433 family)
MCNDESNCCQSRDSWRETDIDGTRFSVEHVLGLLASGMSHAEIIEAYPELNEESIQLVLTYASRALRTGLD